MSPFLAMHDLVDSARVDGILPAKNLLGSAVRVKLSDLANVCLCQFGIITPFATRWIICAATSLTALAHFISGIMGMRAEEEMIRSDAGPIIAVVTNKQPVRNDAKVQLPGIAVGYDLLPANKKVSVSLPIRALVNPAMRRLFHVAPKSLFRCPQTFSVGAWTAAKARPAGSIMDWKRVIFRAAVEAVDGQLSHKRNLTQVAYVRQGWAS